MPKRIETRDLAPLSLRAAVGSVDTEKRTAEIVWSTGAGVLRHGWEGKFIEELSLDPKHVRLGRLNGGAPLLDTHNGYELRAVLGVVEAGSARSDGKTGTATVRFARAEDDAEADKVFRKVADKIITQVSVGYRVHKFEKTEGADGKVPIMRATDWEPYEVSVVPIGADPGAVFRGAEKQDTNPCEITSDQERSMDEEAKKAAEAADADAKRSAELTAQAQKAERDRVTGITQAVRAARLEQSVADKLIADGIAIDAARAQIIDALAAADDATETRGHLRVEIGDEARDKWLRGAGDWLVQKAAVDHVVRAADKDAKIDPGEFRGLTLLDLARESLENAGVKTRGMDKMRLAGMALTHRSITQSTSDFGVLLENTMHKILLAQYMTTPDTWSRFCARGQVSDFRPHNRYKIGMFGRLDKVGENGEFKNKKISDAEKELVQAATYGNIINLPRQAIVNDDLSAFNRLATMLGRAARLSIEVDVYASLAENGGLGPTLNDGNPIFHARAGGNNIGTGAALSVAALDADRVVMASQKDPWGNEFLDLRPAVLLVPIGLGGDARVINDSQFDTDSVAANSTNKFMKPNRVRGLFRDIVDTPRISGTRRYLFADPGTAPVLEVSFLDGQTEPFLESQDGFRVDGVEWKVRLDYAVGGVDYRGAITNAGA